jgi:hypothetical protein
MDADGTVEFIRSALTSARIRYELTGFRTEVRGPIAWTTYRNRGTVERAGGRQEVVWLESAVCEAGDDGWRLALLHSAPDPRR